MPYDFDPETARRQTPVPDPVMRRRAEERLQRQAAFADAPAPIEAAALLHELRVHQIELEMQNEELRRGQLELDAQREKYFELFDLAPVGYLTIGEQGLVGDANLTAAHLLGVERQMLVGQPFSAFVFAADRDAYYQHLREAEKSGTPQTCELRLQRLGGGAGGEAGGSAEVARFWARLESRPRYATAGELSHYHLTFTDVQEKVLAAEALRESEERFRALVEWTPEAIVVHRGGKLIYVNPAAVTMFGAASTSDLVSKPILDLIHPDCHRAVLARVKKGLDDHLAAPLTELRYLKLDGTVIEAEVQGTPIVYDGEPAIHVALRDVTARKRAEEALRHVSDRLSLATRAAGVGIWDYDVESGALTWDEQMFALYGITREQFGGAYEAWQAGLHPDDRERGGAEIQMALRGEHEFDTEFRVLWPDGVVRDVRALALVQRDASGRPTHMIGTNWDITDQRREEQKLRETTALLSGLLASIPDIVFFKDAQGVYLGCNPEFARFVGRDMAAIIGATDHDLFSNDIADFFREQDEIMMALGEPRHNEEWIEYPDGSRVLVDTHKAPLRDVDGQVIGLLAVSRDITVRKREEEALREVTDRLSLATRAGGVGVWDWNVQSDTLTWDEQMFALYGVTREQFGGAYEAWQAGVHPDDRERGDAEIQMALRGEQEFDTDFRVLWPDGAVRIIRAVALVQRDASGRPARMIGTNRDITEFRQTETEIHRLQAEEALRQSEEAVLVAVAAERSRLARELHDSVTQALFAATLKCEALQRSVESTTPQAAEMLVDLHRLTRGALAEMRTLLLEMRPDALSEVPLDELLRHLAVACESRARINVSLTTYGRLELALDVKLALYRIAQEALNNVVRHAGATRAWLDLRCSAATLHLVVGDDGCGFEPSHVGSGQLGLRMMHERAAAAGALMRVETGPGRGTLVTLEWPGGEE